MAIGVSYYYSVDSGTNTVVGTQVTKKPSSAIQFLKEVADMKNPTDKQKIGFAVAVVYNRFMQKYERQVCELSQYAEKLINGITSCFGSSSLTEVQQIQNLRDQILLDPEIHNGYKQVKSTINRSPSVPQRVSSCRRLDMLM